MGRAPHFVRSGRDLTAPDGTTMTPLGFIHPCEAEGCTKDGSFGYKVAIKHERAGHWFCAEHRELGEALYQRLTSEAQSEAHEHTPSDDLFGGA